MLLTTDQLRTDGGTQPRSIIEQSIIEDYAQAMLSGANFPPVVAFYDGSDYWLADGFHRLNAAKLAELETIEVEVNQGTRRDAVLYSVGTNSEHGLRRTNDDKRRAVKTLLLDEEWSKWSDREIARRCAVGNNMVTGIRHELDPSVLKAQIDLDEILATRNGTTYTQKRKKSNTPKPPATTMQSAIPTTPTAVLDRSEPAPIPVQPIYTAPIPVQPIYTAPVTELIPEPDEDVGEETGLPDPNFTRAQTLVTAWETEMYVHINSSQRFALVSDIVREFC